MDIRTSRTPSAEQVAAIEDLTRECDRIDGTSTEIDYDTTLNYHRDLESWIYAWSAEPADASRPGLEGFASIFAPEESVGEVTVMVRPEARGHGLFTTLLATAEKHLRDFGYREILVLRDTESVPGGSALEGLCARRGAVLDHREFSMILRPDAVDTPERREHARTSGAAVSHATVEDLDEMTRLSAVEYGDSLEESRRFLEATMAIPARSLLVARESGGSAVLGMVSVFIEGEISSINALLVAPNARRRGLGSLLLDEAVSLAAAGGARHIGLEVDAMNRDALGLYLQRGFETVSEIEYWRMPIVAT
jgi:ribosomal protein S18 acetylase RimI-like enzyme